MADEIISKTVSTIESIFGSLNITTEDKGKFLTVDNNFNPYWQNINETSVGDSWAYTQFSTATTVQLPKLSTSIGGIVAVLRNDKTSTPAYIALKPHEDETIMGQTGVWANNVADENYASVVLKAISYTNDAEETKQTWVIVNGVNTWNNFANEKDVGITTTQTYNIRVQKIGSNTLSGGVGMSGVEFASFRKLPTSSGASSYLTNVASDTITYTGYNTNYQIPNPTGTQGVITKITRVTETEDEDTKSISEKLAIFDKTSSFYNSITTYAFNVAAPNSFLLNKTITNITTLYAYIALNNANNSEAFALYKVSGKFTLTGEGNKVNINNYDYIPLFSIELTDTNQNSIGRLIEIPIDDKDINGFTIAFESENYKNNTLNFDFIGVAQEKSVSISPEVEFENCGIKSIVVDDSTTYLSNTLNWDVIGNVDNYTGGSLQIFNNDKKEYKLGNSITKTVFKFSQIINSPNDTNYTKYGTLLIDWLNTKYYYNATTGTNTSIVDSGSFYDKSDPIEIKYNNLVYTKFKIDNFGEYISSLPIKVHRNATVSIVIENYKTQYSTEKEKYNTPVGSVIAFAGTSIPKNWRICNGDPLDSKKFPELAEVFGVKTGNIVLPDLRDKFIMGASEDTTKVRSKVEAGLPNITGTLYLTQENEYPVPTDFTQRYTGAFTKLSSSGNGADGTRGSFDQVEFNASRSSSIYGRSNTVQPPSVILYYIIKVK